MHRTRAGCSITVRFAALPVFAGCFILLLSAARVQPSAAGFGTHQQLPWAGLNHPCMFPIALGYPCPTCGMTTAFAHAVRGQLLSSFHAQPAGFLLAVATVLIALRSLDTIVTGKVWKVNWYRVSPGALSLIAAGLLIFGWMYKIMAGLLTGTLPVH